MNIIYLYKYIMNKDSRKYFFSKIGGLLDFIKAIVTILSRTMYLDTEAKKRSLGYQNIEIFTRSYILVMLNVKVKLKYGGR